MGYSNSSGNFITTNWNPITVGSIPAGSIQNYQLSGGITYDKLAGGIQTSQLANGANFLTTSMSPTVTTQIIGNYTVGFSIQNGVITNSMLTALSVATGNIQANAVTVGKFDNTGTLNTWLSNNAAGTPAWNPIPSIVQNGSPVVTTNNVGKVPQVATSGASDSGTWSMVSPQGNSNYGRILQQYVYTDNTPQADTAASGNVTCALNALPKQSATKNVVMLTALTPALFTPKSPASTIVVEACLYLCNSNNGAYASIAALFQDSTATAVAAACSNSYNQAIPVPVFLKYVLASSSGLATTGTTFSLGFSGTALNVYYNSVDGTTKLFGGALGTNSWCKITEYL